MVYKDIIERINKKAKTKSEVRVNRLMADLDLDYIDSGAKIRNQSDNREIGELDGIFKHDKFLFLLETDESAHVDSKKIDSFFSKWSSEENIKIIKNIYHLPSSLEVVKIYVCVNYSLGNSRPSLNHHLLDSSNTVLSVEDLDYFENSYRIIGKWERNDLFAYLGLKSDKTSKEVDALSITLGGNKAYLTFLNAHDLLRSCYVNRRTESREGGYQRVIKANRINKISKAISASRIIAFPNAIILSAEGRLRRELQDKPGQCKINFPTNFCSVKVIDGQHRLLSFSHIKENEQVDHNLAVIIFENLDDETELETFITINNSQKVIDPNLLLILMADRTWDVKSKFFYSAKTVNLLKKLYQKNSLLKGRIYLGYNDPRSAKITLTTLVGSITRNNLIGGKINLLFSSDDTDPYNELNLIFNGIKIGFGDRAEIKNKGFFVSNRGISILFRLIQFFIRNRKIGKINAEITYEDFFKDINSFITTRYIEKLETYYGEGGKIKACADIINHLKKKHKSKYGKMITNLAVLTIKSK